MGWRAKVKTCTSSRPSLHPFILLAFRESGDSSQERILGPQENKTKINASKRIPGESIYWANWDWSIVFRFRRSKLPRSEIGASTLESSNRSKIKKENHLNRILRLADDVIREETGASGDKQKSTQANLREIMARAYIDCASGDWSIVSHFRLWIILRSDPTSGNHPGSRVTGLKRNKESPVLILETGGRKN